MTRTTASASLVLVSALSLGACLPRIPPPLKPCPIPAASGAVVTDADSAIEAVRTALSSDSTLYTFDGVEVEEAEREWVVNVSLRASEEVRPGPRAVPYRVCKANGEVDSALRL